MPSLTDLVTELCQHLNDHVLADDDAELSVLDMLDSLASCDLVLEEDGEARSFLAYMELIKAGTRW